MSAMPWWWWSILVFVVYCIYRFIGGFVSAWRDDVRRSREAKP